jgi:isocitrate dehydrogenase kinase/phosphatase
VDERQRSADARRDLDAASTQLTSLRDDAAALRERLRAAQAESVTARALEGELEREREVSRGAKHDAAEAKQRAKEMKERINAMDDKVEETERRLREALRAAERAKEVSMRRQTCASCHFPNAVSPVLTWSRIRAVAARITCLCNAVVRSVY